MADSDQSALERALDIPPEKPEVEEGKEMIVRKGVTSDEGIDVKSAMADVYERAMEAFEEQVNNAAIVEPRYAARNMEVAKQFLDSALEAAKAQQNQNQHKDKIEVAAGKAGLLNGPKNVTNNILVADRNDILKQLIGNTKPGRGADGALDVTPTDIPEDGETE